MIICGRAAAGHGTLFAADKRKKKKKNMKKMKKKEGVKKEEYK